MKIFTWLLIFLLFPLPLCQAKYTASNDGLVVFETDDDWNLTSLGADMVTVEVLSVAYDVDTVVSLKQSTF